MSGLVTLEWHFARTNGKITPPSRRTSLSHRGTPPVWNEFEVTEVAAAP
jgi:hypothetical protein